ncbi:MAG TPA: phage portal protein [Galbitalea sp.]
MLSPDEVVDVTRDLWKRLQCELPEHDRVRGYALGRRGVPSIPEGAGDELADLARLSVMNVLKPVVDAFSSISVEGFRSPADETNGDVWDLWQADRLDARQSEVYRPAVQYGSAYTVALKDSTRIRSPRQMIAVYTDPSMDLWPIYALEHWIDHSGTKPVRRGFLYDDEFAYPVSLGNAGIRVRRIDGDEFSQQSVRIGYEPGTETAHGGAVDGEAVCPAVRFVNDRDTEDCVIGEVSPLITNQRAINAVNFDRLVVSRFGAFPQKYAIGWAASSSDELARVSAARLMAFDDENIKVGDFAQASVEGYNAILGEMKVHVAKTAHVPVGAVVESAQNVGADTIAALDAPYQAKLDAKRRSFGESWEQHLALKAAMNGVTVPDDAEVVWDTSEARSFAQVIDGISKLVAADPSLLPELLQDIPGWNQQRVDAARAALRRGAGSRVLNALRGAASATGAADDNQPPAA